MPPISKFIKKKGENTRGGTRPKPSEKKEKETKKRQIKETEKMNNCLRISNLR